MLLRVIAKNIGDVFLRHSVHPRTHRFLVIVNYWSNFRFRRGTSLFNALIQGEFTNL